MSQQLSNVQQSIETDVWEYVEELSSVLNLLNELEKRSNACTKIFDALCEQQRPRTVFDELKTTLNS